MIPASMGLAVPGAGGLESFNVTASWGTYESVETDEVTKAGVANPPLPADSGGGALERSSWPTSNLAAPTTVRSATRCLPASRSVRR
jgi:hypothetical protein